MSNLSVKRVSVVLAVALCCLIWPLASWGTTIGNPAALNPAATIIDFESYAVGTPVPFVVGIATIDASSSMAHIFPTTAVPQIPGVFGGLRDLGFGPYDYTITFSTPVSQFGLGLYDLESAGNQLIAYDANNQFLEFFPSLPTAPANSIYAGFVRSTNDIAKVVVVNAGGDTIAIDNVGFYSAPVPIPGTLLLLGSGLIGLVGLGRRKFFPKN